MIDGWKFIAKFGDYTSVGKNLEICVEIIVEHFKYLLCHKFCVYVCVSEY